MDAAIHRGELPVAEAYRAFARREARGVSAVYENWATRAGADSRVIALLETLPRAKRQPNLVFAAARWHGAGHTYDLFRETLVDGWDAVRTTILQRSTQTNEAARCAVLLPYLAALPQPLALVEVGASAGLCLLPDRYSYRYDDGTRLDPGGERSDVVIDCRLGSGVAAPLALPRVEWRAGIDLSPLDVWDPDACAWLETLVWPGQKDRRDRLRAALAIARRDPPRVVQGDLNDDLSALVDEAPAHATLVVFHSAVLAYVPPEDRERFVHLVRRLPGYWISNEGRGVLPSLPTPAPAGGHDGRFLLSVDGFPRAWTDPHGRTVSGCAPIRSPERHRFASSVHRTPPADGRMLRPRGHEVP